MNELKTTPRGLLTRRQKQIVELMACGMMGKQVCAELNITDKTLQSHVRSIKKRTGDRTLVAVVVGAIRRGEIAI